MWIVSRREARQHLPFVKAFGLLEALNQNGMVRDRLRAKLVDTTRCTHIVLQVVHPFIWKKNRGASPAVSQGVLENNIGCGGGVRKIVCKLQQVTVASVAIW